MVRGRAASRTPGRFRRAGPSSSLGPLGRSAQMAKIGLLVAATAPSAQTVYAPVYAIQGVSGVGAGTSDHVAMRVSA